MIPVALVATVAAAVVFLVIWSPRAGIALLAAMGIAALVFYAGRNGGVFVVRPEIRRLLGWPDPAPAVKEERPQSEITILPVPVPVPILIPQDEESSLLDDRGFLERAIEENRPIDLSGAQPPPYDEMKGRKAARDEAREAELELRRLRRAKNRSR